MKKLTTLIFNIWSLLFAFNIMANSNIPQTFPEKTKDVICADELCYRSNLGPKGEILIDVWTTLDANEFEDENDALNQKYFDFDHWADKYAEKSKEKLLTYTACKELPTIFENGLEIKRHFVHYSSTAMGMTFVMREVSKYWPVALPDSSDILAAYAFTSLQKENETYGPESLGKNQAVLNYPEGLNEKSGYLMIKGDEENEQYIFFLHTKIIPNFWKSLTPETTLDYMLKSVLSLAHVLLS